MANIKVDELNTNHSQEITDLRLELGSMNTAFSPFKTVRGGSGSLEAEVNVRVVWKSN